MSVSYLSGEDAATVAVIDLQATQENRAARAQEPGFALASATALVSAISAAGQLGLGIAQAATSTNSSSAETLEVEIDNESQLPVVVYETKTSRSNVARFPRPLGADESDTLVLAKNDGFEDGESELKIFFLVGDVEVELIFSLDDDDVWQVDATIAGENSGTSWEESEDGDLHFYGAQVTGSDNSFALYTASIEKTAGFMSVTLLDLASS